MRQDNKVIERPRRKKYPLPGVTVGICREFTFAQFKQCLTCVG
jgi:hypothetical protein